MIDKATGEIRFPAWEEALSASITREQFLSSSLSNDAAIHVQNEPYCSWCLQVVKGEENKWWTVVVYFKGEELFEVLLAASDKETGSQWEDWSEATEKNMLAYYEQLLKQVLGFSFAQPRKLTWGTVEANYDARSGSSHISVRYKMI